ncbi:MAG: hypothetical protein PHW82_13065 [Bacteroidales bacterium]|nr:hypothetical protein [Bacteroidales bacterium]
MPHTNRDIATIEINETLREQIFEIIKNQLRDNDPPETKITYDRLKNRKPYNNVRYVKNLLALPKKPFE